MKFAYLLEKFLNSVGISTRCIFYCTVRNPCLETYVKTEVCKSKNKYWCILGQYHLQLLNKYWEICNHLICFTKYRPYLKSYNLFEILYWLKVIEKSTKFWKIIFLLAEYVQCNIIAEVMVMYWIPMSIFFNIIKLQ